MHELSPQQQAEVPDFIAFLLRTQSARKLRALGKEIAVHWFEAGHGSYVVEQSIEHQERMLRFAYRVLS